MKRRFLAWVFWITLAAPQPARAVTGADSMVVVESRVTEHNLLGERSEGTSTSSASSQRMCTETEARVTRPTGGEPVLLRQSSIVALDRGVIWTILPDDTSYSEVTLQEVRQLDASMRKPVKISEKALGPGERVAGFPTRRFEIRFHGPRVSAKPSAIDSAEFVHQVWIARGVPGLDLILAFAHASYTRLSAFDESAADLSLRERGTVVKAVTRLRFPPSMRAMFRGAEADSQARAVGIDTKTGSMVVKSSEAVSVRVVPVRPERFEVPKGLKKKPSQQSELLQELKKASGKAPGR